MVTNNAVNISGDGFISHDGSGTFTSRTIESSGGLDITNPTGAAGDPNLQLLTWEKIENQSASSSASLVFDDLPTSTFSSFVLKGIQILADTAGDNLLVQLSDDNGMNWTTTGYKSGLHGSDFDSTTLINYNATSGFSVTPDVSVGSPRFLDFILYMFINNASGSYCFGNWAGYDEATSTQGGGWMGGTSTLASADSLRVIMTTDTIENGIFTLYGLQV